MTENRKENDWARERASQFLPESNLTAVLCSKSAEKIGWRKRYPPPSIHAGEKVI
jgi:hypothetical protein